MSIFDRRTDKRLGSLVDPSTTGIRFTTKALAGAAEAGGDLYILITQGLDQVCLTPAFCTKWDMSNLWPLLTSVR